MNTTAADSAEAMERRKSAAGYLLRWMDDEITNAPERHVRELHNNIAVALCRASLEKSGKIGEKISASTFASLDGTRLNCLHLAAIQDPTDADGRKQATEHTMKAAKILALENKLLDADNLLQYTVPADSLPVSSQSRMDRMNAAKHILELLHEMTHG